MKKIIIQSGFFLFAIHSFSQGQFRCDTAEAGIFKRNNVMVQKEFNVDKKTKAKTLNALREYDANGFL